MAGKHNEFEILKFKRKLKRKVAFQPLFFLYHVYQHYIQKEKRVKHLIFKDFILFFCLFKSEFNRNAIVTDKYGVDQMAGDSSFFFKFHSRPIF